jgi:RHS repeat-associated protein
VTNGTALFFTASDSIHGREVWSTDGTESATAMIKDIAPGSADSNATLAAVLDGKVIFTADDGNGPTLWMAPPDPDYTDLYYTGSWQVIEEREDGEADASKQYVWSPVYVDALILRDRDADSDVGSGDRGATDSGLEERIYFQHDLTYNTSSILVWDEGEDEWVVGERYLYVPYGEVTITDSDYDPNDGNESDFDSNYLFQGKRLDFTSKIYDSRARSYSTTVGWLTQDPAGFIAGYNRYNSYGNNPITNVDWFGNVPYPANWNLQIPPVGGTYDYADVLQYSNETWNRAQEELEAFTTRPTTYHESRLHRERYRSWMDEHQRWYLKLQKMREEISKRPTIFTYNTRPIRKSGDCKSDAMLAMGDLLGGHAYVQVRRPSSPFDFVGWGLVGTELKGTLPHPMDTSDLSETTHKQALYRSMTRTLQHGRGAGKLGVDATDQEIAESIAAHKTTENFGNFYNCQTWAMEAAGASGLEFHVTNASNPYGGGWRA